MIKTYISLIRLIGCSRKLEILQTLLLAVQITYSEWLALNAAAGQPHRFLPYSSWLLNKDYTP
jgi:hypothetical protein